MKKFPLTVVDKFFETPGLIRDFALSQEYYKSDDGKDCQDSDQIL